MTENIPKQKGALVGNERARIPLALIGVLLVVASMTILVQLDIRGDPNPDTDPTIAIDQTETTTQASIRDGTMRATEIAAEQPLTELDTNEWAAALEHDADSTDINWGEPHWEDAEYPSGATLAYTSDPGVFENYLKVLIYLDVQERFENAGQTVGDVETTVSLPEIEDDPDSLEDAIDRVKLHEPEPGVLDVTIDEITIEAEHDGHQIEDRQLEMNVSVTSPIVQLHDRVELYQYYLNESGVTERGFTQRFTNRIYALGWVRGWAQNRGAPIVEVLGNRHIEPSANDAIYRTQQDVFGAADPNLQNAVRLGWTCMALEDGQEMGDEYLSENWDPYDDIQNVSEETPGEIDPADDLCDNLQWVLGDQATGEHFDTPDVEDLLGNAPGMDVEETIGVDETAYLQMGKLIDNSSEPSYEDAIQRAYTVDVEVDSSTSVEDGLDLDPPPCDGGGFGSTSRTHQDTDISSASATPLSEEEYYEFEATVEVEVKATRQCDNGTTSDVDSFETDVRTTLSEAEIAPDSNVRDLNRQADINRKYHQGGSHSIPSTFNNYIGVSEDVTEDIIGESTASGYQDWLEDQIDTPERPGDLSIGSTTEEIELDYRALTDHNLETSMLEDTAGIQDDVSEIHVDFERSEMIASGDDSPFQQLADEVDETGEKEYLEIDGDFESVGDLAVYEARYDYFDELESDIENLSDAHDEALDSIEDQIDGPGTVDDMLDFARQGVSGEEPDPVALESSDLTDDITYEVSGSPTYLVPETITQEDAPAVDRDEKFAPLSIRNKNYLDLPYDDVIDGIINAIADFFGFGDPDAEISFNMASDVLIAGDRAVAGAEEDGDRFGDVDSGYSSVGDFESDLSEFEDSVEDGIETYKDRVTGQVVIELYGDSTKTKCRIYANSNIDDPGFDNPHNPSYPSNPCLAYLSEEWTVDDVISDTYAGVEDAVDEYDSTTEQAQAIGKDKLNETMIDNVVSNLDDSEYHTEHFETHYGSDQWTIYVESTVEPAVMEAGALQVTIDDTDTVEDIDEGIQSVLGDVGEEMVEDRIEEAEEVLEDKANEKIDDVTEGIEDYVGDWTEEQIRAARVPAGVPLLPLPTKWYMTANAWDVEANGEYARFEVTANMGTPDTTTSMTYVREKQPVELEIAGEERTFGTVEPISFEERTFLTVVTRPGVGVGDRDDENPECSPTYPEYGYIDEDGSECGAEPTTEPDTEEGYSTDSDDE